MCIIIVVCLCCASGLEVCSSISFFHDTFDEHMYNSCMLDAHRTTMSQERTKFDDSCWTRVATADVEDEGGVSNRNADHRCFEGVVQ